MATKAPPLLDPPSGGPVQPPLTIRRRALATGFASRVLPPFIFSLVVLAIWQAIVSISGIRETILPQPTMIARHLYDGRSLFLDNAWVTLKEILLGFRLALTIGLTMGVIISSSKLAERAVYPWMVASQMVPIPAIAPLLVLWFGFGILPKVIVVGLIAFFPLAVNTVDGLTAPNHQVIELMRTLGASRWKIFRTVRVPAALPFIFSGAKVAIALSTLGAAFGEWVGASNDLGYLILTFNNQGATADVFAAVVLLSAMGIALFTLTSIGERLLLPWYHAAARAADTANK